MRRFFALVLVFVFIISLVACGGDKIDNTTSEAYVSSPTALPASTEMTTQSESTDATGSAGSTAPTEQTTTSETPTETEKDYVSYSDFGAVGDGEHDDFLAIKAAHDYANERGLPIRAESGATYYIWIYSVGRQIDIKTDTDWTGATFIIDDRCVPVDSSRKYQMPIFRIAPSEEAREINGVSPLSEDATNIGVKPGEKCVAVIENNNSKTYIRTGIHASAGDPRREPILVDENGDIDPSTPLTWGYDEITSLRLYPIDETTLTVRGGHFHTVANEKPWNFTYFYRSITVERSNTVLEGITHTVEGETDKGGAPYNGFIYVRNCADVTVRDCVFTPHYIFAEISATESTAFGYDIHVNTAVNVTFVGCTQTLPIEDENYWGVFTSNFARNITLENCVLSRFDAHRGVYNVTIKGCTLGHQGIRFVGFGTALIENTTVRSGEFINLRNDYGSTFKGTIVIRNCRFEPLHQVYSRSVLILARNTCDHYYGYRCYFPEIDIDGLVIDDRDMTTGYKGIYILPKYNDRTDWFNFENDSGYFVPKEVRFKNITLLSGYDYNLAAASFLFTKTEFITE
ncbi:MAG: right-handed parallel beta-helix repeat-containing protein [Clostridia bacterium]|nr:right-handed parallel beta-helix repeat-containing protein [Clostridia bacterium]